MQQHAHHHGIHKTRTRRDFTKITRLGNLLNIMVSFPTLQKSLPFSNFLFAQIYRPLFSVSKKVSLSLCSWNAFASKALVAVPFCAAIVSFRAIKARRVLITLIFLQQRARGKVAYTYIHKRTQKYHAFSSNNNKGWRARKRCFWITNNNTILQPAVVKSSASSAFCENDERRERAFTTNPREQLPITFGAILDLRKKTHFALCICRCFAKVAFKNRRRFYGQLCPTISLKSCAKRPWASSTRAPLAPSVLFFVRNFLLP